MDVPRLRRAGSVGGLRGQGVALENNDVLETVGEGAGGRQPRLFRRRSRELGCRSELTPSPPPELRAPHRGAGQFSPGANRNQSNEHGGRHASDTLTSPISWPRAR